MTPCFAGEIDSIFEQLLPETGNNLAGAAVPCWHAVESNVRERQILRGWSSQCGEMLLHGWTHRREHRPGIVSWATGRADEFGGCSRPVVIERVRRGRLELQEIIDRAVPGLVPPAWRLPVDVDDLRSSGVVPVIVIHPADVRRGHVVRAVELIRRLKSTGAILVRICDLMPIAAGFELSPGSQKHGTA